MNIKIIDKPAFTIVGLAINTSLENQAADSALLMERFYRPGFIDTIPHLINREAVYSLHENYKPDGSYVMVFGYEVTSTDGAPADAHIVRVPAARYSVFTAIGPQPEALIKTWEVITQWRGNPNLKLTGSLSFSIHDERSRLPMPEVDTYIPATLD